MKRVRSYPGSQRRRLAIRWIPLFLALCAGGALAEPACLEGVAPLLKDGKQGEALARLDACPAESADDAQVLLTKGRALAAAGRLEEALSVFGRLAETQPRSASALNNVAVVQAKLGRLAEARASLEKAVMIAPDFALAQENLADVYVRLARIDYEKVAAKADAETQARVQRKLAAAGTVLARQLPGEAAPAAAPAAVLPAPTLVQGDREAAIAVAKAWARDWSAGNWAGYRGHYDAEFAPDGGRPFAAWEAERRRRVAGRKGMQVTLDEIELLRMDEGSAELRFVQTYTSPGFSDRGQKTLHLVSRPAGWRIVREAFEPMPGAGWRAR